MINAEQNRDELHISYFNKDGNITIEKIKIPKSEMFIWKACITPEEISRAVQGKRNQEGQPVRKQEVKHLDKYRKIEFIMQLPETIKQRIFAYNIPKKWFMDIETEIIGGLSVNEATDNPKGKVLSAVFCNENNEVYVVGIKPISKVQAERITDQINDYFKSTGKVFNVKYKCYTSESQMLADLFYSYIPKMPLLTGWNFLKFDWKYMWNRCNQLSIDPERTSPAWNKDNSYARTSYQLALRDKWDKEIRNIIELPCHRGVVDYMTIFEKWDTSIKLKSSMGLDAISKEVLGLSKVEYPGTLTEMYNNDYEKFLFYNAVDTILVQLIDEKCQTFNTMLKLACEGKVQLHDAAFASDIITTLFSEEFYKNGVVFSKPEAKTIDDSDSYSGGYVEEPGKGIFKDVTIFDYESMFPSIMLFLNSGIDTLLGHTKDGGKTYIGLRDKQVHKIDPEKHIFAASGVVYSKESESVMRAVVSNLFGERIAAKNASSEIESEITELKRMLEA